MSTKKVALKASRVLPKKISNGVGPSAKTIKSAAPITKPTALTQSQQPIPASNGPLTIIESELDSLRNELLSAHEEVASLVEVLRPFLSYQYLAVLDNETAAGGEADLNEPAELHPNSSLQNELRNRRYSVQNLILDLQTLRGNVIN